VAGRPHHRARLCAPLVGVRRRAVVRAVAAPGGRISIYGGTAGAINNLHPALVFWKQLTINGSTMGTQEDFKKMVDFVNEHKVHPHIDKIFPLKDANEALTRIGKSQQLGKIVISNKS
jgi:zinc-binding alcohol dehydrogenase/oxidoreductase